jgi:flagellar hook-length control protein FliK
MELRFPGNLVPQSPTRAPQLARVAGLTATQTTLQLGRQFTATVVERQGANQYLLEIYQPGVKGETMLRALSVTALEPGQSLRLEVVDNGPPPQLRVMPPPLDDTQEVIGQALRQFLPKQEDLHSVMERLTRFMASHANADNEAHLPQSLRDALRNVLSAMPDKGALSTAEGLKQAIQNSGLFLEARLAQMTESSQNPAQSLAQDMKARLLKLADGLIARLSALEGSAPQGENEPDAVVFFPRPGVVSQSGALLAQKNAMITGGQNSPPSLAMPETAEEPAPGQPLQPRAVAERPMAESVQIAPSPPRELELKELLNKTESALAKIVLDQLASAPRPDSTAQSWRLDLPFHNQGQSETASLKISREGGHRNGGEAERNSPWAVTLELDPPGLGKLYSRLTLLNGELSGVFWSEMPATAELVGQHLDRLDARLRAAGLKTGRLNAAVGAPPEPVSSQAKPRLLDERA